MARGEVIMKTGFVKSVIKGVLRHTSLAPIVFRRYPYNFTPRQLCFLMGCIDATAALAGPVVEVGCFRGNTTVWLNKHMDDVGIEKQYFAIDTFTGFLEADIRHEVGCRRKSEQAQIIKDAFVSNKKSWVETTLSVNAVKRVTLVQADASALDYTRYSDISLAIIDVDLYLPVKNSLARIYGRMAKGGIIVVDDCAAKDVLWDGALQAYSEFVEGRGIAPEIIHEKLGLIRVPA
jgi:O-methyltransferase